MAQCLGAELTYVSNPNGSFGSNKFYKVVLAGTSIFTCYGRRKMSGSGAGNFGVKTFPSVDKAAAEMWRLLRSKTGKGYHVVDAAVFDIPDAVVDAARAPARGYVHPDRVVMGRWDAVQRGERRRERQAVLNRPDLQARSPRTPKEGKLLLLELLEPVCSPETLAACALADPSERFLVPMGLSHPSCPDEVKVLHYLSQGSPLPSFSMIA